MNISEGSKDDFQKAIMENGFYPEEIPPCFKVKGFFDAAKKLDLLKSADSFNQDNDTVPIQPGGLELARFNATKRGFQRRIFSCPNPIFFIHVARFLGEYRGKISRHFRTKGKQFSHSIPKIDPTNQRAVKITRFDSFDKIKRQKLSAFPFLVKIDTSRFYPSIYTHAIPWAYHGKEEAKTGDYETIFMNHLDRIIRSAQRKQTIGIPVGPDTSRIVAEILSVAVDEQFRKNLKGYAQGVRLVDDVVFGADSEERAHEILNAYREALRYFELDINENKTRIIPNNVDLENYWVFSIKRDLESQKVINRVIEGVIRTVNQKDINLVLDEAIRVANQKDISLVLDEAIRVANQKDINLVLDEAIRVANQKDISLVLDKAIRVANQKDISLVLDEAIRTANQTGDDAIIKYTISQLNILNLFEDHWSEISPFLKRAAVGFPHSLSSVAGIVSWMSGQIKPEEQNEWKKICLNIIKDHAYIGHDSEVVWACWLLKHLDVDNKITKPLLTKIIGYSGPLPALMAIDLAEDESDSMRKEAIRLVKKRLSDNPMKESDWLLSYEAERLFKHPLFDRNRSDYSLFGDLMDEDVQFYNPSTRILTKGDKDSDDKVSRKTIISYDYIDESQD